MDDRSVWADQLYIRGLTEQNDALKVMLSAEFTIYWSFMTSSDIRSTRRTKMFFRHLPVKFLSPYTRRISDVSILCWKTFRWKKKLNLQRVNCLYHRWPQNDQWCYCNREEERITKFAKHQKRTVQKYSPSTEFLQKVRRETQHQKRK